MSKNPKGLTVSIDEEEGNKSNPPKPQAPKERKAIPFIYYDDKKGFVLNKDAEDMLLSHSEDRNLGIISIVGKYRTGKSFFTNRVLLGHTGKGGFSVGPTVNPCTKGLWIWNEPLKSQNPDYPEMDIFLIDTEGFGGTDENLNHDSRIFLFSLLLSSFFIYNSVGNIDENALNALHLIIKLAKDIQIKTGKTTKDQDPAQFFPSFLWVVRDFTLKLVDLEGKPLAPKEYLEKALEFQKGVSDAIEEKNRIRKLLKHFFQERDCVTMVRPLEDENQLQKLDELPDNMLRPEFVSQMDNARNKIFKKIRPKSLNGNTFNGSRLVELIHAYINAINSGQVPNIEHAFQYMMKNESKKAFQDSLMKVQKELSEYLKSPIAHDDRKMKDIKKQMEEAALKNFKKKALGDEEMLQDFMKELSEKVRENFKKVKEKNLENWYNVYQESTAPIVEEIEKKLKTDQYSNFYEFQLDMNKFKENFEKDAPNSGEKSRFLKETTERLYAMAAEYTSKKTQDVLGRETMRLKKKIEETEDDYEAKRKNWERDKEELEKKLNNMERERAVSRATHQTWKEKYEIMKEEKDKLDRNYSDLMQKAKDNEIQLQKYGQDYAGKMEKKLESIKNEHTKIVLDLERKSAMSEQEANFAKRELESLNTRIKTLEKENHRLKEEVKNGNRTIDELRKKASEAELSKAQELMKMQMEYEKNMQELKRKRRDSSEEDDYEGERRKKAAPQQWPQQYPNWLEEKIKLENEVNFLKGKLEEGQKVQEAFKMAIEHGVNFNDNENIQTLNNCELVETNKNLSNALEKSEVRCKDAQDKLSQVKIFKKMVSNASSLQCLHCGQHVLVGVFMPHLLTCAKIDLSTNFNRFPMSNTMNNLMNSANKFTVAGPAKDLSALNFSTPLKQMIGSQESFKEKSANEKKKSAKNSKNKEIPKENGEDAEELRDNEGEKSAKSEKTSEKINDFANISSDFAVNIAQTLIKEGGDHKPFIEYLIYCKKGQQKWLVSRKYKNFCDLHQLLLGMFPGVAFPSSSKILINSFNDFTSLQDLRKPKIIDERKILLESYLQEISQKPEILNCLPFRQFVGIEGKNGKQFSNDFLDIDSLDERPQNPAFSARNPQSFAAPEDFSRNLPASSFRIDKKMLPESPESFMRGWENQSGGPKSGVMSKSPIKDTIKKEPVLIHHGKNRSEHEVLKSVTPEKSRNLQGNHEIIEKVNEIYRSPYYNDDFNENPNSFANNVLFVYDCGHCLSANIKEKGPNPRKVNGLCPACLQRAGNKGSAGKNKPVY